jgi:hypothetical protein
MRFGPLQSQAARCAAAGAARQSAPLPQCDRRHDTVSLDAMAAGRRLHHPGSRRRRCRGPRRGDASSRRCGDRDSRLLLSSATRADLLSAIRDPPAAEHRTTFPPRRPISVLYNHRRQEIDYIVALNEALERCTGLRAGQGTDWARADDVFVLPLD